MKNEQVAGTSDTELAEMMERAHRDFDYATAHTFRHAVVNLVHEVCRLRGHPGAFQCEGRDGPERCQALVSINPLNTFKRPVLCVRHQHQASKEDAPVVTSPEPVKHIKRVGDIGTAVECSRHRGYVSYEPSDVPLTEVTCHRCADEEDLLFSEREAIVDMIGTQVPTAVRAIRSRGLSSARYIVEVVDERGVIDESAPTLNLRKS